MNPDEFQFCTDIIKTLTSKQYSSKNYLFLTPVDTSYFPTYNNIIKRPMDLGTAEKNLQSGYYQLKEDFYADTVLCFENAELFHKDIKENQWIVKLAKDMKKLFGKVKRNLEKKVMALSSLSSDTATGATQLKISAPKLKLNLKTSLGSSSKGSKSPKEKKKKKKSSPPTTQPEALSTQAMAPAKKKISLKLNKPGGKVKSPETSPALSTGSQSSSKPTTIKMKNEKKKVTAVKNKPKIKLTISNKGRKSVGGGNPSPASDKSTLTATKSVPLKSSPKLEIPDKPEPIIVKPVQASRGKELPSSVVAAKAKKAETAKAKRAETKKAEVGKESKKPTTDSKKAVGKKAATDSNKAAAVTTSNKKLSVTGHVEDLTKPSISPKAKGRASTPGAETNSSGNGANQPKKIRLSISGKSTSAFEQKGKGKKRSSLSPISSFKEGIPPQYKAQCSKVLSALKRKEKAFISYFMRPVNDPKMVSDYLAKIPSPSDIGTIGSK